MPTDTLIFGPNHKSAGTYNDVTDSLPPSTYYLNKHQTSTEITMEASAGGGGGGAWAHFEWTLATSNRKAGGGGGQSGASLVFSFYRYIPFLGMNGISHVLTAGLCDMAVYSQLYSTLLGAGGVYGNGAYNSSGNVAEATGVNGTSGGDAKIVFIPPGQNPSYYAISFITHGGQRGTGAHCKAQLSGEQYSNVGVGGKSEYLGTIQTVVNGVSYLTQILSPPSSNPNGNMRIDINGTIFDQTTIIYDINNPDREVGRITLGNTYVEIRVGDGLINISRRITSKVNGADGSNTSGSENGGAGGSSTYGGTGGNGGTGRNSSAWGNRGASGTSNSYIKLISSYNFELPYEVCLGHNVETGEPVWVSQSDIAEVYDSNGGWRDILSAEAYDGSQWKRIGPTNYNWDSGEYTDPEPEEEW